MEGEDKNKAGTVEFIDKHENKLKYIKKANFKVRRERRVKRDKRKKMEAIRGEVDMRKVIN